MPSWFFRCTDVTEIWWKSDVWMSLATCEAVFGSSTDSWATAEGRLSTTQWSKNVHLTHSQLSIRTDYTGSFTAQSADHCCRQVKENNKQCSRLVTVTGNACSCLKAADRQVKLGDR